MKKKLLIIGGSGFFGRSILNFIEKSKKYDGFFSNIYLTYRSEKIPISSRLKKKFRFTQIKGDISKIKKLPFAEYIIYCALSKELSKDRLAIKNYIKLAKKFHKKSVLVYTSSGAVYGNQSKKIEKLSENNTINYQKQFSHYKIKYAKIKLENEQDLSKLTKFNIKVIIARCFAFVGRNIPLSDKYVIGNIINDIINRNNIKIRSKHRVIRSYMHTDDLSDILLMLLKKQKKEFDIYNVGSDHALDLHSTVKKLSLIFNLRYKFSEINDKENIDRYLPNIKKLRKNYKYNKKFNSFNAILKTINTLK